MLAATQRLRHGSDFATAMRGGRRVGRGTLVVHLNVPVHPAQSSTKPAPAGSTVSPARAGFVVSKAVGNAVVRNKVRRRLRHLVRDRLPDLPAGAMLVVRALPDAATTSSVVLGADLDAALATARAPRRARPAAQRPR